MSDNEAARLARLIQKLEFKIKSLNARIAELEKEVEVVRLDKDIAEEQCLSLEAEIRDLRQQKQAIETQIDVLDYHIVDELTEKNLKLAANVADLKKRINELEELRSLDAELDEHHKQEEIALQQAIIVLESQLAAERTKRQAAELHQRDADMALAKLTKRRTVSAGASEEVHNYARLKNLEASLDDVQQELSATREALRRAEFDLALQKHGKLGILARMVGGSHFARLKYCLTAESDAARSASGKIEVLVEGLRGGTIDAHKVLEETQKMENDLPNPKISASPIAALEYLMDCGLNGLDAVRELTLKGAELDENLLSQAVNTRSQHDVDVLQLHGVKMAEVRASEVETTGNSFAALAAEERLRKEVEQKLQNTQGLLDAAQVRLEATEWRASQAGKLAEKVSELEQLRNQAEAEALALKLKYNELCKESDSKLQEIEKLREAALPATLDAACTQEMIDSLRAALKFLHKTSHTSTYRTAYRLSELTELDVRPAQCWSSIALHPMLHELRRCCAKFNDISQLMNSGQDKRFFRKGAIEQLRLLSVVDELTGPLN